MPSKSNNKKSKKGTPSASAAAFHVRFDIPIDVEEARRRFMNRVNNLIFDAFIEDDLSEQIYGIVRWRVAMELGEVHSTNLTIQNYASRGLYRCLQVIEVAYMVLQDENAEQAKELDRFVQHVVEEDEGELGISWQDGTFTRTGARLLDEDLVNTSLRWLAKPQLKNVYEPFSKGLRHFLNSEKRPELLYDVITDMYEAVEALSKVVTTRPRKDLSANAELFIKQVNASPHYKVLLKDYIAYANTFRHALEEKIERPKLTAPEVESFIYLTGLFIRLAMNFTPATPADSSAQGV